MAKKLVRLTEGDLHRIIKESVNRVLNEGNYYEYEEIIDVLNEKFDELKRAIYELQEWYLNNVEHGSDMYNSYAGKYGDEAKKLLSQAYNRLGSMLNIEEEY